MNTVTVQQIITHSGMQSQNSIPTNISVPGGQQTVPSEMMGIWLLWMCQARRRHPARLQLSPLTIRCTFLPVQPQIEAVQPINLYLCIRQLQVQPERLPEQYRVLQSHSEAKLILIRLTATPTGRVVRLR